MFLPILILLALSGALALWLGLRGRTIDDHPVCRKCRYDLSGLDSPQHCPECGAELANRRGIRIGQRRKRPVVITVGAFLLLSAAFGGVVSRLSIDWNEHKPFWLLALEARHGSDGRADAVASEIIRRDVRLLLTPAQRRQAVAIALEQQADVDRPWNWMWGEFMRYSWARGTLERPEQEAFVRGAFAEGMTVLSNDVVRSGGELPIRIMMPSFRVSTTGAPGPVFSAAVAVESVSVGEWDDDRTWFPMWYDMFPQVAQLMGGSHATARVDAPPGEYDVHVRCRVGVSVDEEFPDHGARFAMSWDDMFLTWTETIRLQVRVAGIDEPIIELVRDEPLAERLRRSISVDAIRIRLMPRGRTVPMPMLNIESPPMDLGFSIHLRPRDGEMAGVEIEGGEGAVSRGRTRFVAITSGLDRLPTDTTSLDIILRTSVRAAERDFDVTGPIWDGEIEIEDVPVLWQNDS